MRYVFIAGFLMFILLFIWPVVVVALILGAIFYLLDFIDIDGDGMLGSGGEL